MLLHLVVLSSTSKRRPNTREYFLLISLFITPVKCKYKFSASYIETTREQTSLVLKLKGKISIAFKVLRAKKSNVFVHRDGVSLEVLRHNLKMGRMMS